MAEVLAGIGAAAAITQLIRYGFEITMFLSALPRQLRSTPQQIQDWTNRTNAMLSLLLLVKSSMTNLDQDCLFVFEQCEAKIQHIQAIVEALPTSPHRNIKDRMTEITLVFRRKMEIETLLAEFQETFRMLVSILTM